MKLFFSIFASACCCLLYATSQGENSLHLTRSNFQDKSFITVSYTTPAQVGAKKDLKEFWKQFLFYSLLQERLQQKLPAEGVQYTCFQKGFLDQSNACTISISCTSSQVVDILSEVCRQIDLIKKSGFSEKEFKEIKEKAYAGLCKQKTVDGEIRLISNDLSSENPSNNLNALIATSKDLIEMATLSEVSEYSRTQIIDENREIDVVVPSEESFISQTELCQILEEQKWIPEQRDLSAVSPNLVKAVREDARPPLVEEEAMDEARPQMEEISYQLTSDAMEPPLTAATPVIEEKQPDPVAKAKPAVDYYSQLPISGEEKRMISKLVITLAENNVFKLLFEKKKLEKLGKRINHLHPFKFLGTILSDPRLFHCLKEIRKSTFKWEGFMDGLVRRMNEEVSRNNVEKFVEGFAKATHKDPKEIQKYIETRNFEGMVLLYL